MFQERRLSFIARDFYGVLAFLFKLFECILCICGIFMISDFRTGFYNNNTHDLAVVACGGFLISSASFLIVYMLDTHHHYLEVIHLFTGAIINIVSGGFSFYHYIDTEHSEFGFYGLRNKKSCIIGWTTMCCGVVMVFDLIRELYVYHIHDKKYYT